MLLLACLCRCLPPILTVAAALASSRAVFVSPRDKQAKGLLHVIRTLFTASSPYASYPAHTPEASSVQSHSVRVRHVAASAAQREAFGGTRSDLLAVAAAYDGWCSARAAGGREEHTYCDAHYVNGRAMREVHELRVQLMKQLVDAGLAAEGDGGGGAANADDSARGGSERAKRSYRADLNAADDTLTRGVICAALYPNLAQAERARGKSGMYEKLSLGDGLQAWMHPSSINANQEAENGLYVYLEKVGPRDRR